MYLQKKKKGMNCWERLAWVGVIRRELTTEESRAKVFSRWKWKTRTGWFKLNHGNSFPGQVHAFFWESDYEILHTASMSPYEDLTWRLVFSWRDFSSIKVIWEIWTSVEHLYWVKKKKKTPRRSGLGIDIEHVCKNFRVLSLEKGVDIRIYAENCVTCFVAFSCLVSG